MKYTLRQALFWLFLYFALALLPTLVAFFGTDLPSRSFWVEFSVGLGFVGLTTMVLQFFMTGRFQRFAASFGLDSMLQFHRRTGLIAFFFVLAHPLILFLNDRQYLIFLDPRENFMRALALSAVLAALILLIVTTLWRQSLNIPYEWWRAAHGFLALFVVIIGLGHIFYVGFYVSALWKQIFWLAITGAAILLIVNTRIIKPLLMRYKSYRVIEVREERGDAWTLALEPVNHRGMRFRAGQFAWLTLKNSPFSLQQHPFSFSSSALQTDRFDLTIKELGDFTSTIKNFKPGDAAFVEGPYGAFTLDMKSNREVVFIVGGVGITPIVSILRTLRDMGDQRRMALIYGNSDWESILFREELDSLEQNLNLKIVHVLENPPEDWTGETGLISEEIITRYLPENPAQSDYFICGPPAMMDIVEPFLRERGIPLRQIFSERFSIV
jgi:predicted ferric reductase